MCIVRRHVPDLSTSMLLYCPNLMPAVPECVAKRSCSIARSCCSDCVLPPCERNTRRSCRNTSSSPFAFTAITPEQYTRQSNNIRYVSHFIIFPPFHWCGESARAYTSKGARQRACACVCARMCLPKIFFCEHQKGSKQATSMARSSAIPQRLNVQQS